MQDAFDLIEFATGVVTSHWGKVLAQMAHQATFNLKMIGVGNENWGPQYVERLKIFLKATKIIIMYKNYLVPTMEPM